MEWKLGLKTGAVAGIVFGFIGVIINLLYMIAMKDEFVARIQSSLGGQSIPISMDDLYNISLVFTVPSSIFMGIIAGMFFGIIFMLVRTELHGKNDKFKGLTLAILVIIAIVISEMAVPENILGSFFMFRSAFLLSVPLSIISTLLLGYLFGFFLMKFEKKKK